MSNNTDIQEFSIVLAIRNHNPAMVTLDFLKASDVIAEDWELARPAALSSGKTQLLFKNGVRIEAQLGNVSFSENMGGNKTLEALEIPNLARQYAARLPNLDYRGVGINPRRFIAFEAEDGAHQYITSHILSAGAWHEFGTAPMQAGINLVYTRENSQLRLAINEARLKMPDKELSAVMFSGNFNHGITGESATEKLQSLNQIIDDWQGDWAAYQALIDNKFLAGVEGIAIPYAPDFGDRILVA